MIIDDYLEYSRTYKDKYGERCIVLMQVGSFYEFYSISDDNAQDIYKIADICNILISRKNKAIVEVSINNPLMAGFPLYTLAKYTQVLLNNNYTIVLVEQVTEPPNPERKVTEILSPGMNISISNKTSNYMMVLYYEWIDKYLAVGISGIDLSTGKTFIYEAGSSKQDPEFANDEAFRLVNAYSPSELVIISDKKVSVSDRPYILKNLCLNDILVHYKWDTYEYLDIMRKLVYQKGILEKAFFSKKSMLSIIEVLNLEKYEISRISLCCLLQFAYEHNADIIKELQEPEIFESQKHLTIEFNSAVQLNLVGLHQGDKPLLSILNRCSTAFGSRAFKERLLNPIIDADALNRSYDNIEKFMKNGLYKDVSKKLCKIVDLERIKRKMTIGKIAPMEWCSFHASLENASEALKLLQDSEVRRLLADGKDSEVPNIQKLIDAYKNVIDLEEISKYNLQDKSNIGNFFAEGVYVDVDRLVADWNTAYEKIQGICTKINDLGYNDSTNCKLENNDRDGYYISITKKRFETAMTINKTLMTQFDKKALTSGNMYKLTNETITTESQNISKYNQLISTSVLQYYHQFVADYIAKYADEIDKLIRYLTQIDINCCCARNACEYSYHRPKITADACIKAENMRHPIIERIEESVGYVGNDVMLGQNGILLYGINASGKSSFMKAIGLNVIMAQAGMFVASRNFEYQPYNHIFTRISGMDNIYKGMSSFTVEMTELRNILQRCNKHSLVIGDEICCGTESVSALAIVASGIDTLVKKKATFIFATHLHELTSLKIIKKYITTQDVKICHMHIHIDAQNRIVYDRKLQEGQGSQVYGLEVCKSLDMPKDFMKIAETTRKEVQELNSTIINKKRSVYNAKVILDNCKICGAKAIDTHHIKYQQDANPDGFIEDFHKNKKHNLVALCKDCHKKEHSGELDISGYMQTSEGIILEYK